jgi:hypothetical protein
MGFFFMPTLFTAQNGLENHQKLTVDVCGLPSRVWEHAFVAAMECVPFVGGSSEQGVVDLPF